ncbi:MAG: carbon storage regulator [Acidobacteria bacterium]|nr:carbon storage regulator [Acidobacteriota bacterium]
MLVIRRRLGETFRIGDDVEIQILDFGGGQVKIGIKAPLSVPVLREEVFLAGRQNKLAAAQAVGNGLADTLVQRLQEISQKSSSSK